MELSRDLVNLISEFHNWLMSNPPPASVEDIRKYWQNKRQKFADKILEEYMAKLEIKGGK